MKILAGQLNENFLLLLLGVNRTSQCRPAVPEITLKNLKKNCPNRELTLEGRLEKTNAHTIGPSDAKK